MKYEIKHSCGHVETVDLIGRTSERERRIAYLESQPCTACKRAAELEHAQKVSEEYGLPDLVGSEKQIAWALKIRADVISRYEDAEKNRDIIIARDGVTRVLSGRYGVIGTSQEKIDSAYQHLLSRNSASWWIDNREWRIGVLIGDELAVVDSENAVPEHETPAADPAESPKQQKQEISVVPENLSKQGEVVISVSDDEVTAKYVKDDEFRAAVKKIGYEWDADRSVWCKQINSMTGSAQDRAAEVANTLLNAGFQVLVPSAEIRDAAVNASYAPEHKRWIVRYDGIGVVIEIEYGHDDIYQAARRINGAKWVRGYGVAVPASSYEEIRDFAEIYNYRISNGAEGELESAEQEHKQKLAGAVSVSSPAKQAVKSASEKLEEKLKSSGVIDDLRDDD